jgi:hypothetical protein
MRAPLVPLGDVFSKLVMRPKVAGEEIFSSGCSAPDD